MKKVFFLTAVLLLVALMCHANVPITGRPAGVPAPLPGESFWSWLIRLATGG